MNRLQGKTVLISGGARGMGAAHARAIVAEGGKVVIGDILDAEGQTLAKEIGGGKAVYTQLDVTSYSSWEAAVETAVDTFGSLTTLVNNAGIMSFGTLEEFTVEAWEKIISINLTGQFLGAKAARASLLSAAPASIINISSVAGYRGFAGLAGYNASKYALRGLTKSLALELAPVGVRVNSVHPGAVATVMTDGLDVATLNPMKRAADPSELSGIVVYLASDESSFATGAEFIVDGGELAGGGVINAG
ncbi:SDR family oxidoreductase [Streptomyces sp. NPDC057717]|uniref:SDR family oxidoreductase n=1 Tax=Streptomyces sp. NPDC057717 TaxID=3346224 RepID=UPI003691522A